MRARLVPIAFKQERSRLAKFAAGFGETPTREDARQHRDIGLSITAVDAERVQFKYLASRSIESLAVEAASLGLGSNRALIVEVKNHRRMRFRGD